MIFQCEPSKVISIFVLYSIRRLLVVENGVNHMYMCNTAHCVYDSYAYLPRIIYFTAVARKIEYMRCFELIACYQSNEK